MLRLIVALLLAFQVLLAQSEYERGVEAFKQKNYTEGMAAFHNAANTGDVRSFHYLGMGTLFGLGTEKNVKEGIALIEHSIESGNNDSALLLAAYYINGIKGEGKDLEKARFWGRFLKNKGNAAGALVVYQAMLADPELEFVTKVTKTDNSKYQHLAERPAKDRLLESEGFEMLAYAVDANIQSSDLMLAGTYLDAIGEDNNLKALAILKRYKTLPPLLQAYKKQIELLLTFGESRVTVKLMQDTMPSAMVAAAFDLKGTAWDKEACPMSKFKLLKTEIESEILNPSYLPVAHPAMKNFYLIGGEWKERWVFDVCGEEAPVTVTFKADGLGGASYQISILPKKK